MAGTPRQPGRSADAQGQITPRTREVLALLAEGLTAQEAADRLFVSRRTVETHAYLARKAMEVRTTAAAALRAGLVQINTAGDDRPERTENR